MIEWLNSKIVELVALGQNGALASVVVALVMAYWKTKALITLLVALVTGGILLWAVTGGAQWFRDRVGDETGLGPPPAVVVEHSVPAPGDPVVVVDGLADG